MSLQLNTYAIFGLVLPYPKDRPDLYDRLEPFEDDAFEPGWPDDDVLVLFDGMNANYVAIGRPLAKSGNHEGFEKPIKLEIPEDLRLRTLIKVLGFCQRNNIVATSDDFALHIISHYR